MTLPNVPCGSTRHLLRQSALGLLMATLFTGCGCDYPNIFLLPDNDEVSIALVGDECTNVCETYASGRCKVFNVTPSGDANDLPATCRFVVSHADGRAESFDASYEGSGGCIGCVTSSLSNEEVQKVIDDKDGTSDPSK